MYDSIREHIVRGLASAAAVVASISVSMADLDAIVRYTTDFVGLIIIIFSAIQAYRSFKKGKQ